MAEIIQRELFENGEVVGYEYGGRLVRCKDCCFFNKKYGSKLEYTECAHFDCDVPEYGYCWWGERREDA